MPKLDVNIGDILESRHSKRKGRLAKVIYVDSQYATLETIRNADNATTNTVGHTSDVKIKRLGKDYTLHSYADEPEYVSPEEEEEFPEDDHKDHFDDEEPLTEAEVHVLESSLAEVGYYFVPDLEVMLNTIDEAVGDDWDEYLEPRQAVELTLRYITEL